MTMGECKGSWLGLGSLGEQRWGYSRSFRGSLKGRREVEGGKLVAPRPAGVLFFFYLAVTVYGRISDK